jgi:murein L,D-transpeptidase YcbB/YkuD
MLRISLPLLACLMLAPSLVFANSTEPDPVRAELLKRQTTLQKDNSLSVDGSRLYAADFLFHLYELNNYNLLWNKENTKALIASIQNITGDGLTPHDYLPEDLAEKIKTMEKSTPPVNKQIDLDLLLSESFVRAVYNLLIGKVDPETLDPDFNFSRSLDRDGKAPLLLEKISNSEIEQAFDWARPKFPHYQWLKNGLEKYRTIQTTGGWQPVPEGATLKPGQSDARVSLLRNRLIITGDYTGNQSDRDLFDTDLTSAVEHFQQRHGLEVDGMVGKNTLAALNKPVEQRIDQIRVALERQRWYSHEATDEFIVVDIAGFKVYWFKDGKIIWDESVQVGKKFTHTPVFKDRIRYLEFNPTWTIPPGILKRIILPNLKKDPGYLDKKGYLLLQQDGTPVDPKSIDWSSMSHIPYIVRQPAGEDNALGLVKFMFPNKHLVYLHDTNHKELFDRTQRTFSSGCVRVNNALELAEKFLARQQGWDRQRIDSVLASGETTRVNLEQPIRIIIAYNTVSAHGEKIHFKSDIYNRDPAVLKKLNGGFRLRKRDQ